MNEWIIQTQNLTRDFTTGPAGETVRAVDGLTLEVPRGIVFGFLGPNGSGKTTTIRLLLGLLEPTGGRAQVFGLDTIRQSAAIRERTGALLEHTGLYERLSAEDNLEFYGRIAHMPALERRTRIRELLDQMGLWERRKETVGNWSRGMKQKLAIARALMHRPELIFLAWTRSRAHPCATTWPGWQAPAKPPSSSQPTTLPKQSDCANRWRLSALASYWQRASPKRSAHAAGPSKSRSTARGSPRP
jgi:ABC-2 type transport system ATP-binding protein